MWAQVGGNYPASLRLRDWANVHNQLRLYLVDCYISSQGARAGQKILPDPDKVFCCPGFQPGLTNTKSGESGDFPDALRFRD